MAGELDWHTLSSSNVSAAAYDETKQEMYVHFHSGRTYTYSDVPVDVFEGLLSASSPGAYMAQSVNRVYRTR